MSFAMEDMKEKAEALRKAQEVVLSPEEDAERFEVYKVRLMNFEFLDLSRLKKSKEMKVPMSKIDEWNRKVDWVTVRNSYLQAVHEFLPQIDRAMIKQAIRGKVDAAKLCYERLEGWRAGLDINVSRKQFDGESNEALLSEIVKAFPKEQVLKMLGVVDADEPDQSNA